MANKTVKKIEATKPTLSAQYSTFTRKRKVAAYARVSTAKEEQENSFDAQVSYTVDFLEKKIKPNEGEVPQYYIEHSHEATGRLAACSA